MPSVSRCSAWSNSSRGRSRYGLRAAENFEQRLLFPCFRSAGSDQLLHQDVEGLRRNLEPVEDAGAHGADHRGLLHEVVAREGKESAFGNGAAPVAGTPDALHADRDGARGLNLAHQIHGPDVDAELERRSRDEHANLAVLEAVFRIQAQFAREAAVVAGDVFDAKALAELKREPSRPSTAC